MTSKKIFFYLALALCIIFPLLSLNNKASAEESTQEVAKDSKEKANTTKEVTKEEGEEKKEPDPTQKEIMVRINKNREVLAWITVLDKNEIEAANLALKKSYTPKVQQYAQGIIKDHSKNLEETLALSKEEELKLLYTPKVTALKEDGADLANILKPLKGADFDKAYMSAMVNGHANALQSLVEFISNIGPSFELESLLNSTKKMVERHLNEAKAIKVGLEEGDKEKVKSS